MPNAKQAILEKAPKDRKTKLVKPKTFGQFFSKKRG
jgi:hypothetical protein